MSMNRTQDQIIAEFADLTDGFAKYQHLIHLGKQHPPLADRYKTDENAVAGCQSQVWIHADVAAGRLRCHADSDSLIVKGILALLLRVVHDQPVEDLAEADFYFIDRIDLRSGLSPARANGLTAVIAHLKAITHPTETPASRP